MTDSFTGHPFVPPARQLPLQAPQPFNVAAQLAPLIPTTKLALIAVVPAPPAGTTLVVVRVNLLAVRGYPLNSQQVDLAPTAPVGPALLRIDGVVVDVTDDGALDTWEGQLIVPTGSVVDVAWPALSESFFGSGNPGRPCDVAGATFFIVRNAA